MDLDKSIQLLLKMDLSDPGSDPGILLKAANVIYSKFPNRQDMLPYLIKKYKEEKAYFIYSEVLKNVKIIQDEAMKPL